MPSESHDDRFLVFGAPTIGEDEIREVVACLRSGWIGTGPKVAEFEEAFRAYKGADHAVAVNSCTAALHLSILAAGVGPGDEVVTTPLTFCATINAIIHAGATPVPVDVDLRTMNIDAAAVEAAVTPRTRAVVPVHFAGRPCAMNAIVETCRRHDLRLIEDCAHAIETESCGVKAGTIGDFGCFSFYVTKNVTTGEGGMILPRRADDAARLKTLALHGMDKDAWRRFGDAGYRHYDVVSAGFKYNMMDLQAAIGIHQLRRVEESWERRRDIWNRYQLAFTGLPVRRPAEPAPGMRHGYHLYCLRIDAELGDIDRDGFLDAMSRRNIGVGVHYRCVAEHPYYQDRFGWRPEDVPHATRIGRETVSLPLSPGLSDRDVGDVIAAATSSLAAGGTGRRRRAA